MVRKSTFSLSTEGNHNHNTVVLDDMSILTESLLPMNSDNDIVIADQVDIDADAANNNNNNIPNIRRGKYHSTCHPRFIPDVAKNMTWNDPFYIHDNEVIAVFDLNPNMSAGRLLSWPGFCYVFFGGYVVLNISWNFAVFDGLGDGSYMIALFIWILARCVLLPLERSRVRRGYKHLAIARRGIYMDISDGEAPNNDVHMRRTIIQLEDIQECYVTSFLGTYSHYDVVVKCKNGCVKYRRIHGYFETQKFVDIVNAMIVESRTTPNIVATW